MSKKHHLIQMWRKWLNCKKIFNKNELDEMEDHLFEEINYLVNNESLNEEEAFHKAVDCVVGKKSDLEFSVNMIKEEKARQRKLKLSVSVFLVFMLVSLSVVLWNHYSIGGDHIAKTVPFGFPVDGEIVAPFGERIHPVFGKPDFHLGIDIKAPHGTEIKSTADGIAKEVGWKGGGHGYRVLIEHCDIYATLYAHCSEFLVKEGDRVERGQVIALVGSTGVAIFPHVHYEILENGIPIDPESFNNELLSKR